MDIPQQSQTEVTETTVLPLSWAFNIRLMDITNSWWLVFVVYCVIYILYVRKWRMTLLRCGNFDSLFFCLFDPLIVWSVLPRCHSPLLTLRFFCAFSFRTFFFLSLLFSTISEKKMPMKGRDAFKHFHIVQSSIERSHFKWKLYRLNLLNSMPYLSILKYGWDLFFTETFIYMIRIVYVFMRFVRNSRLSK